MTKQRIGGKRRKLAEDETEVMQKKEKEESDVEEEEDEDDVLDLAGDEDDDEGEDEEESGSDEGEDEEEEEGDDDEDEEEEQVEEEASNQPEPKKQRLSSGGDEGTETTEVPEEASAPKLKKAKKLPILKSDKFVDPEVLQKRSGVLYFSTIPPHYTVTRMRRELGLLGQVGRMFLQPEKRRGADGKKRKIYTEGWVEFPSKDLAKRIAASINGSLVTGRKKGAAAGIMWNVKYLSGFKWIHLTEQLAYEKKMETARMRSEINQAKRVAEHFAEQIEKGAALKRLEEKVLKKNGVWEAFNKQRSIGQRKAISAKKSLEKERRATTGTAKADDELMRMIFADD